MKSQTFVRASETQWAYPEPGVKRQVLGYDERLCVVRVDFVAGTVSAEHSHPHSQSTYVSTGRFVFNVGAESSEVGPGDGIMIPSGVRHNCVCLEEGTLIDTFSPCREDFL